MRRGELYRAYKASARDPKKHRVFVVVSRQVLIDSRFSTVICTPIYSKYDDLSTQVRVGIDEGLKHDSSIPKVVVGFHSSTQPTNYQLPG
jgi:mRNA interferase MazF